MLKKIIGIVLSTIFLLNFVHASEIPIYDIGKDKLQLIDFSTGLIIDSNQTMNINQISKIKDINITNSRFTINSINNNYWFVFKICISFGYFFKRYS